MYRVIRTSALRAAVSEAEETAHYAEQAADQTAELRGEDCDDYEQQITELREQLATAKADLQAAEHAALLRSEDRDTYEQQITELSKRLREADAEILLDSEDRVALRMLLRIVRKQSAGLDRIYALFRHGRLHSVHLSTDDAEAAAEEEGAPRDGWTSHAPGAGLPPASEVTWRIQPLRVRSAHPYNH
ncbi:hypothetical protein [Streptomyces sp. 8L]|uniref:hypothetical protein n=1 Tax=Streptomyces sp. 8L TaxID=2877242 RepID=UPI001CD3ED99|nr:hypothetical protein [Streptomyces sp. 8L]MCA1219269.1 hypothetical protein [Streptomyces sp. 8L]